MNNFQLSLPEQNSFYPAKLRKPKLIFSLSAKFVMRTSSWQTSSRFRFAEVLLVRMTVIAIDNDAIYMI